jgi:predicted permease
MLETIVRDLRYAVRMLRKSPVFTAVAVLVITIGTGAVTTIFSVANAVALRPLPGVTSVDGVVEVHRSLADGSSDGNDWVSYPYYRHLRDGAGARRVADIAAWAMMPLTIATGDESIAAQGTIATGNYFRVLGVRPALGRFFTPDEDGAPGAHPVVVLSHGFWTTKLAGDPGVIGRTVRVNGYACTVVGVAPPKFGGVFALLRTDAWVPMAMQPQIRGGGDLLTNPRPGWLQLFARVPGDVDRDVVRRELSRATAQWVADGNEPASYRRFTATRLESLSGLPSDMHGRVLGFLALLLGASGLVLLIASINVAAMLLARAVARRRETAVRLALGAARGRLVRQLLTESLLLYALGAVGGVLLALYATRLLVRLPLNVNLPLDPDFSPDLRVLAFTLVVSLATGVAFGLMPALQSTRVDINSRLRDDTAGAGSRRSAAQSVLVAGQMAVSLLLLVAAGLFLRALDRGRRVDLGFDPSNVAVADFLLGMSGYDVAKGRLFQRALKDRMAQTPGVVAVTYARDLPLSAYNSAELRIDGSAVPPTSEGKTPVRFVDVDAGYFEVVKMPIVQGRGFTPADDEHAARVAVVNQAFARRFWPTGGAVGRTFYRDDQAVTVVGVARDAKYSSLAEELRPFVYFAMAQGATKGRADFAELFVRTSGDPARLAPAVRAAVRELDPTLPAPAVTTLSAATSGVLLPQRVAALVTAVLGLVGLLLAAVGLYGIVAYVVGQRAREIGVRMALGAGRLDVLRLVVGDGMRPVAVGMAVGLLLAVGATRLLMSFLLGVSPLDAVSFAGGAAVLTAVALAASYLPARRAAATNPVRALRAE